MMSGNVISRNVDQIKGICEPTTDSLGVSQEKSYRNIDLYNGDLYIDLYNPIYFLKNNLVTLSKIYMRNTVTRFKWFIRNVIG